MSRAPHFTLHGPAKGRAVARSEEHRRPRVAAAHDLATTLAYGPACVRVDVTHHGAYGVLIVAHFAEIS